MHQEFLLAAAISILPDRDGIPAVLVVEDDRAVRYLFTEVLRAAGYEVIACENGTLGLEAARSRPGGSFCAVVTDATMPGLDSREMIDRIRTIHPGIPVMVVSGSFADSAPRPPDDPITVFLPKPLSPERLKSELRRLIVRCPF